MHQSGRLLAAFGASAKILTLAEGVLRTMLWTRIRLVMVATLAVGFTSVGASFHVSGSQEPAAKDRQPASKRPATTSGQTVRPKAEKKVTEQPTAASPEPRLRAQELAVRKAKLLFELATLNRELAEISLEEYRVVTYPQELATAEGDVKLAESEIARAQDRRKPAVKNKKPTAQQISEELGFKKAQYTLELAQAKRQVLVDYTKDKTIKELKSEIEKAKSDELAKKATYELELGKQLKLERELRPKAK